MTIRCLIPDLPGATELAPWLTRIDQNLWYTNFGPLVREFERRLIDFIGSGETMNCVTLSSGTSALELGLHALGIGAGKRVLMPALTFPATALAVMRLGAEPVFADVCAESLALSPTLARRALDRERIDLVMPVASYGRALPALQWDEFVTETNVPVFADAAPALGVQTLGQRVHWAFSLHATKPMGIGEGGLFVTADEALAGSVRRLTNFGFDARVIGRVGGTNAKLSEYAAAIGLAQLERWPLLIQRRRAVLREYRRHLAELPRLQLSSDSDLPPATLCVQLDRDAADVADALARKGIETRRWYLPPLHEHPAFEKVRRSGPDGAAELPVTQRLSRRLLGLPFHTHLTATDVATVVRALTLELANSNARRTERGQGSN